MLRRMPIYLAGFLLAASLMPAVGGRPLGMAFAASAFHGAWPYQVPPAGHYNTFVTTAIFYNAMYQDLIEQPLATQYWHNGSWMSLLATDWQLTPPDTFTVQLRRGVKWQDGSDFTARDVVATFQIGHVMNWVVWRYVDRVEAVDEHTVRFHMARPSTVVPRYVLRERIRSSAVYGEFARRAAALLAQGKASDSDEVNALRLELSNFRPRAMIGTGPYRIDPNSITEAQLTLAKWDGAWNAGQVRFDRIVVYNGETPTVTPLVLAKQVDYATHGFPPATEKAFVQNGIQIIRPPTYSGPALYFNHRIEPLNRKEVRQAIAYAVDRAQNATVSLGDSAIAQKYMSGVSDNLLPQWLSGPDLNRLNRYEYNPNRAAQLLTGIGFRKGADGIWVSDKGKRLDFELIVPAEYADWSAAAENLAEQLTRFGIKTTVRGITFTQEPIDVENGRFQLAIQSWGVGNPHPHFSLSQDLFRFNINAPGPGMSFPMVQQTAVAGRIDLEEAVVAAADGLDEAKQKAAVARAVLALNELLPIVPLWERYGNNAALDGVRVTNWPKPDDPIYRNSPYADSFTVMLILNGTLRPGR